MSTMQCPKCGKIREINNSFCDCEKSITLGEAHNAAKTILYNAEKERLEAADSDQYRPCEECEDLNSLVTACEGLLQFIREKYPQDFIGGNKQREKDREAILKHQIEKLESEVKKLNEKLDLMQPIVDAANDVRACECKLSMLEQTRNELPLYIGKGPNAVAEAVKKKKLYHIQEPMKVKRKKWEDECRFRVALQKYNDWKDRQ